MGWPMVRDLHEQEKRSILQPTKILRSTRNNLPTVNRKLALSIRQDDFTERSARFQQGMSIANSFEWEYLGVQMRS